MKEGKPVKIMFVCLGNICRSTAAEGIMKSLVEKEGLDGKIVVDSAGTGNWHVGDLPDRRMRAHGVKRNYDFCSRAQQFKASDFDDYDLIIVMDDSNYNNVKSLALTQTQVDKIYRMRDFLAQHPYDHIPDPYYSGDSGFELVLDLLEDGCRGLLDFLRKQYPQI